VVDDRLIYDDSIASADERTAITDKLALLDSAIDAEKARGKAEDERVAAENKRVEAEKTRTTFTPSVSEDGVLSWTNDKGLENPAPVSLIQSVLNKIPQAEGGLF
jgi:hypothetical protein